MPVTDDVLCARVLSKIGRYSSHPGAIEVTALGGRVVLTGDVLRREVGRLVDVARTVRGVQHVDNQLHMHETAEHVAALQGAATASYDEPWGMRARVGVLVVVALGAALVACAVRARSG